MYFTPWCILETLIDSMIDWKALIIMQWSKLSIPRRGIRGLVHLNNPGKASIDAFCGTVILMRRKDQSPTFCRFTGQICRTLFVSTSTLRNHWFELARVFDCSIPCSYHCSGNCNRPQFRLQLVGRGGARNWGLRQSQYKFSNYRNPNLEGCHAKLDRSRRGPARQHAKLTKFGRRSCKT